MQQRRKWSFSSYLAGFASALFLFVLILGGAAFLLASHGITITVDSGKIAQMVREQVVSEAKKALPQLIDGARQEIPGIVEAQMREQIVSDRMEIAGFVFRVPEELLGQLRQSMQKNVEMAATEILTGIDTSLVAEELGEDVYLLVRQTLTKELHGSIFRVLAYGRIPLQIRLQVSN